MTQILLGLCLVGGLAGFFTFAFIVGYIISVITINDDGGGGGL